MTILRRLPAMLGSVTFWGFVLLTSILLFPGACVLKAGTFMFDRRLVLLHRYTSFWASLYTWCNPLWQVRLEGEEHLSGEKTFVIVSNHQSMVDIFVLFRIRAHYKWVSKAENFGIPFIGWNMSLNRYIRIDRGSMKGHLKMMRDCERALHEGNSILIFPEGTRSIDGILRPFKVGAFELAIKTSTPVLPIAIIGSAHALPKEGFVLKGNHKIKVKILPPIRVESFAPGSGAALAESVHRVVEIALESQI